MRFVSALALAAGLFAAGTAAAESGYDVPPSACAAVIENKLAELKVSRGDIDKISLSPRMQNTGDDNSRVVGIDAWVRYKTCAGSLIIDMERDCRVRQVYSRGACMIPGVKAF